MTGKPKYTYCDDYFEEWTANVAYLVGLFMADGSIDRYSISIELKTSDVELLQFARQQLAPDKPIELTKRGQANRIRFSSKKLVISLAKHGIIPAKTGKERIPPSLPTKLLGHFLRGYFDGDGWVVTRRNSIETGICCASLSLLEKLQHRTGLGSIRERQKKNCKLYEWNLYQSDTLRLRDLMYPTGNEFGLSRKKNKLFSEFYIPSIRLWTNRQVAYLIAQYGKQSLSELAQNLGKSYKAVSKKIWSLSLTKNRLSKG